MFLRCENFDCILTKLHSGGKMIYAEIIVKHDKFLIKIAGSGCVKP